MQDEGVPEEVARVGREIILANDAFYAAFESLDAARMDAVWSHDDSARCVHPGARILLGWDAVRESWAAILHGAEMLRFSVTDVHAQGGRDFALVTCVENIIHLAGGQPSYATFQAVNAFRRTGEGWRMVLHHASPFSIEA